LGLKDSLGIPALGILLRVLERKVGQVAGAHLFQNICMVYTNRIKEVDEDTSDYYAAISWYERS
jgi:hypothetical protein